MRRKKKHKTETSKKIVVFCDVMLAAIVGVSLVSHFLYYDIGNLVSLAGVVAGLCATGHGFYFWKSKVENCRKYPDVSQLLKDGVITFNELGGGM